MTFNVLLFINATTKSLIIKKEHYFMTNMNRIIISVLCQRKALERQYVWKIKTQTENPQLGLLYSGKNFSMHCGNATIDQHFYINILKGFGDDAPSLCKPAKQF